MSQYVEKTVEDIVEVLILNFLENFWNVWADRPL